MSHKEDREFREEFASKVLNSGEQGSEDNIGMHQNPYDLARAPESYSPFIGNKFENLDMSIVRTAAMAIGADKLGTVLQDNTMPEQKNTNKPSKTKESSKISEEKVPTISKHQFQAIQKYPSLIEFLGTKDGEALARDMQSEVVKLVAVKIGENTKEVTKTAKVVGEPTLCIAQNKNIKQFFQGEGWICMVTASGPFSGEEAFIYDKNNDSSYVVRKIANEYKNVSNEFNIVHEFAEKKEDSSSDTEEAPDELEIKE
jgi:hypothetical protein